MPPAVRLGGEATNLGDAQGAEAADREQARRVVFGRVLGLEEVAHEEAAGDGVVAVGIVGGQEAPEIPVIGHTVRAFGVEGVVQPGVAVDRVLRIGRGGLQRRVEGIVRRGGLLEALDSNAASDGVVEVLLIEAGEGDGHGGEEV